MSVLLKKVGIDSYGLGTTRVEERGDWRKGRDKVNPTPGCSFQKRTKKGSFSSHVHELWKGGKEKVEKTSVASE